MLGVILRLRASKQKNMGHFITSIQTLDLSVFTKLFFAAICSDSIFWDVCSMKWRGKKYMIRIINLIELR